MNNGETNNINKNGDSRKIVTLIVLIATLMLGTTGATYAYFALTATNNNVITGTAATASLELSVTQATLKSGNTGVMVPQKEAALATAMNSTNKCVDGNNNVICKVYTITVTNKSTAAVKVNGTIKFANSTNMPNLKWRKTTDTVTLGTGTTAAANVTTAQTLDSNKSLAASSGTATYYIVIWINAQLNSSGVEVAQTDTGTFTATIEFKSADGGGVTSTITG